MSAPRLVSVAAAATYYDVNPATIRALIKNGAIQPLRIGPKVIRIDLDQTDAIFRGERAQ